MFNSCYTLFEDDSGLSAQREEDCVYAFGIDSVWKVASNDMSFVNSLKMKVAVVLGVVHMMFGIFLKLFNNIKQRQWLDLLVLTLPQMVFMVCTFAYMDFLIIYKWNSVYPDTKDAPSIITTMISIYVHMAADNPKDLLFWPS